MQAPLPQVSTCPSCGGALEGTPGGGLGCMFCLLQAGIGTEKEVAQDSTPDALEGDARFGVYEIDSYADGSFCELGRGAMGVTYRATDTSLQRKVALKIIKTDIAARNADARERFVREARAAASLRHENIATVYQFGMRLETAQYFYAMELIEGETLDERVHRQGPLDARTTIAIGRQVTAALGAAEKHGLVHRDLKPANLMLVNPEESEAEGNDRAAQFKRTRIRASGTGTVPVVKIIDFGLAKAFHTETDSKSLTHDRFVGTPAFASPEQFEHCALDVRSDIYSLGQTLWFALTGKTPFAGRTLTEVHRAQKSNVLPIGQLKAAHVPSRLKSLLKSMLAFEPTSRPGTRELAARLQRCSPEACTLRRKRVGLITAMTAILGAYAVSLFHFSPVPEKSIAVLPFENLSPDPNNTYFTDGVQDEILTRLASLADLRVISRTSVMQYKSGTARDLQKIGHQLGIAHVVEGSVQRAGNRVRVNTQLIDVSTNRALWGQSYDRDVADLFEIQREIATSIARQLQAKLTGQEERLIAAKPTDNPEAYDAYLRGLAYTLKGGDTIETALGAQKYLREAVRLDPKFALAWALLSYTDAVAYVTRALQPDDALREEAWQSAKTALTLQPNLGEALMAMGHYHYACLKDYDTATRYLEQARQRLPNDSRIPEFLAYLTRRRGQWNRSETYFKEAEQLNTRDASLLKQHALSYIYLRRFPEALRKLDQVLNITPDDGSILALQAAIAQAQGDLPRAAALLTQSRSNANDFNAFELRIYQAILERRPAQIIPQIQEELAKADPALGFRTGELRFWLGWTQDLSGDHAAAQESWRQARRELESFLKEQPQNWQLNNLLALVNMGLGDKAAAFGLLERAMAAMPIEKDALDGPVVLETLAQVAARTGETDRAIAILRKAVSTPSRTLLGPFTPAVLRLDPMWDPLRGDLRFQALCKDKQP